MNIGDTIIIHDKAYTVWLIEGTVYHLIADDWEGRCYVEQTLLNLEEW